MCAFNVVIKTSIYLPGKQKLREVKYKFLAIFHFDEDFKVKSRIDFLNLPVKLITI